MDVDLNGCTGTSGYQDLHLSIDFCRKRVELDGTPVTMTRKEYQLLALLSQNAGRAMPRALLLSQVWGYADGIRTRTVDVHIHRLREKLVPFSSQYIETIFGAGYRFQPYRSRAASCSTPPVAAEPLACSRGL